MTHTIACALLFAATAFAQGQVTEDWQQTLMLSGSHIYGTRAVVAADDSIYVTGYYPSYRIVTAKLSPTGAVLWQREFSNPGTQEHAAWMALDSFGDVVVAGYRVAGSNRTPSGFVTLKYDAAGNLLWSDQIPSTWGQLARVAVDPQGNVIVLGRTWAALGSGIVTIKYSRTGTKLWTRTTGLSASNQDAVGALAIDAQGNSYITGGILGTMLVASYDPAGNERWNVTTPATGAGSDLIVTPANEVFVVGAASTLSVDRQLLVKLDTAGNLQWSRNYPGILAKRVAVDRHGDLVMTGYGSTNNGYFDWLTRKLDSNGQVRWTVGYDQHRYNDEIPYALTIGPDDEIYVTGQGGPGPSSGNLSYLRTVTVRYSKAGVQEWAATDFDSVRGLSVVLQHNGSVATVGESTFTVFHYQQSAVWRSLEGALAGSAGLPHLEGTGSPRSSTPVALHLSQGRPQAPVWIVVGASRIHLPFLGGTLVPSPDLVIGGLTLDTAGAASMPLVWPRTGPVMQATFQAWIADPNAPAGFAASNALVGISE